VLANNLRINGLIPDLELAPDLALDLEEALTAEATANVLYIAREAISNVLRHARASRVAIRLARAGDQLVLTIRDNGQGFNPGRTGRRSGDGLRNMAERTGALGGKLEVTSNPGQGTQVDLRFPAARRAGGNPVSTNGGNGYSADPVAGPVAGHVASHAAGHVAGHIHGG
jgi:signal transduction histidine kinase